MRRNSRSPSAASIIVKISQVKPFTKNIGDAGATVRPTL